MNIRRRLGLPISREELACKVAQAETAMYMQVALEFAERDDRGMVLDTLERAAAVLDGKVKWLRRQRVN